jgi:hypothetical protein
MFGRRDACKNQYPPLKSPLLRTSVITQIKKPIYPGPATIRRIRYHFSDDLTLKAYEKVPYRIRRIVAAQGKFFFAISFMGSIRWDSLYSEMASYRAPCVLTKMDRYFLKSHVSTSVSQKVHRRLPAFTSRSHFPCDNTQ